MTEYKVGPWVEDFDTARYEKGSWSAALDAPSQFKIARLAEAYTAHYNAEELGMILAVVDERLGCKYIIENMMWEIKN